MVQDRAI